MELVKPGMKGEAGASGRDRRTGGQEGGVRLCEYVYMCEYA